MTKEKLKEYTEIIPIKFKELMEPKKFVDELEKCLIKLHSEI